jgi:hypothetical protein
MEAVYLAFLDNYFDTKKIPDFLTAQKLRKFYNMYLYNLKASPYRTAWVSLDDIMEIEIRQWDVIKDRFLTDTKDDPLKLAIDIRARGTYWPIFVFVEPDGKYRIRDGAHRVWSLKRLKEAGEWPAEKKVLVCTDQLVNGYTEGQEIHFGLPAPVVPEFIELYKTMYYRAQVNGHYQYLDDEHEVIIYRCHDTGYLTFTCLSLLLRNAIFDYQAQTGEVFWPHKAFNYPEYWEIWRGY